MDTELLEKPEIPSPPPPEPPPQKERPKRPPKKPKKQKPQPGAPEEEPQEPPQVKSLRAAAVRKGLLRLVNRNNAVNLALVVLISIVAVIFLLSLMREGVGNFTISLSRTDMYRYGIELSESAGFDVASSRLEADALSRATNISINDLPDRLDDTDGSHNGQNYIAYTFYIRNNGTADLDYQYSIDVKEVTRRLDTAVRVAVYLNGGERQVFAKRAAAGSAEPETIPFATDKVIDSGVIMDMKIGTVDKYTVVIWIEGDDPDCTDELLGGMIKMAMKIEVLEME